MVSKDLGNTFEKIIFLILCALILYWSDRPVSDEDVIDSDSNGDDDDCDGVVDCKGI
jgi:hypothetical protein